MSKYAHERERKRESKRESGGDRQITVANNKKGGTIVGRMNIYSFIYFTVYNRVI